MGSDSNKHIKKIRKTYVLRIFVCLLNFGSLSEEEQTKDE